MPLMILMFGICADEYKILIHGDYPEWYKWSLRQAGLQYEYSEY